jgi:hypothetical protein
MISPRRLAGLGSVHSVLYATRHDEETFAWARTSDV